MKDYVWVIFVVGTILAWGSYVPVLHEGQKALGGKPSAGALRAFLMVGLAYFVTAVLIPLTLLYTTQMEDRAFNSKGVSFGFAGGELGAAGALCIILAIKNGGSPLIIPPLVFAGAPVINTLVSMWWHPPAEPADKKFFVGLMLAATGAFMVLMFKPSDKPVAKPAPTTTASPNAG